MLALFLGHDDEGTIPTNGNFLWYELGGLGVVDKMKRCGRPGVKRGHDQDLTDARTRLHERGIIPWDWVTDETRLVYRYTACPSIGEGLLTGIDTTFLDLWDGDDPPLVLTESRSLSGTLQATAREYRILLSSVNGQSWHLHNEVAPALHDGQLVLYLGDADLSGHGIEGNTRQVLEGYHDLRWERLAITRTQLDQVRTRPDDSTYTLWTGGSARPTSATRGAPAARGWATTARARATTRWRPRRSGRPRSRPSSGAASMICSPPAASASPRYRHASTPSTRCGGPG